ncbi:MAG: hypothetical protein R2746_09460 [Acidimicrobiales bacterium]
MGMQVMTIDYARRSQLGLAGELVGVRCLHAAPGHRPHGQPGQRDVVLVEGRHHAPRGPTWPSSEPARPRPTARRWSPSATAIMPEFNPRHRAPTRPGPLAVGHLT